MVGEAGFEPATFRAQGECATRLRYSPNYAQKCTRRAQHHAQKTAIRRPKTLDTPGDFFYTDFAMEKPLGKKRRKPKEGKDFMFYIRPIDQALIDFLQTKNTLSVSNVIRMALAYQAEGLGLNIAKLMEAKRDHESTPARIVGE